MILAIRPNTSILAFSVAEYEHDCHLKSRQQHGTGSADAVEISRGCQPMLRYSPGNVNKPLEKGVVFGRCRTHVGM